MAWSEELATQYGLQQGLLRPGERATGGLLAQRARDTGRIAELDAEVTRANSGNYNPQNGGVRSMFIEEMNPFEKTGLSALGAGVDLSQLQSAYDMARNVPQQYLGSASALTQQGAAPITGADIQRYQDPYMQQVIDRAQAGIDEQGQRARAKLLSAQGGSRSFGDSSSAIQNSELQRNLLETSANTRAGLLSQGFNTALGAAQQERQNQLSGANIFNQSAGVGINAAQGLGQLAGQLNSAQIGNIQNQIGAGTAIRGYNQSVLDATQAEYLRQQGYDDAQLDAFGNRINSINGSTQLQNSRTPGTLSQVSGLVGLADGLYGGSNSIFGQASNAGNVGNAAINRGGAMVLANNFGGRF